jgi:chloramphenicol 3-O-phosphotransferase
MIILLSGISCSGKSTLSKYLLKTFDQPFVYHNFDFLVPTLLPHEDSFEPVANLDNRSYLRKIDFHLLEKMNNSGTNIIELTYELIGILDRAGCNVIVDTVLLDDVLDKILSILSPSKSPMYLIGIHCSWSEIKRRIAKRGNRKIENVRKQFESSFHSKKCYDLSVDTSKTDFQSCALFIKEYIQQNPPKALLSYPWAL